MTIYLDVSCLNRPYDDQRQMRIRLEAEAVLLILQRIDTGRWSHLSSQMTTAEIRRTPDTERRQRLLAMLPPKSAIIDVTQAIVRRARDVEKLGIRPADAIHVAAAESGGVDVLLTCDDQLLRAARRYQRRLYVRVCDPLTWMREHENDSNT